jgi:hypothetical protein
MTRLPLITLGAFLLLTTSPAHAYNGCTPASSTADKCEGNVAKTFATLIGAVIKCHIKQADAVTKGKAFVEEDCQENGPKSAKGKFDAKLAKLAPTCPPTVIADANNLEAALLSGPTSLDAMNGTVYCDSASGVLIDPSGDDSGFKPNNLNNLKCADGVGKNASKLVKDLLTCHRKKADADFKAKTFDVTGCETKGTTKYDGRASILAASGNCPGCLGASQQSALRDTISAQLNVADPSVFICPTTSTSSSVTTTSSTSSTSSSSTSSTSTSVTTTTSTSSTSSSTSSTSSSSTTSTSSSSSTSTSVTTTSSSSTTSTSSTSTSVTTSTVTTTTLGFTQYKLTLTTSTAGTTFCGTAGFSSPALAPFGGELDDGTATKVADLGKGCLYFGGGNATAVPGGLLPSTSSSILNITGSTTLGAHTGTNTSCTKGALATNHCGKNPGTSCTTPNVQSTCPGGDTCLADAQCFFGPPLSLPNPVLSGISACVINAVSTDASGTFNSTTGAGTVSLPLNTRVYVTATAYDDPNTPTIEACPRCISGHCNGGQNSGGTCTPVGPGLTTLDCPPTNAQFQSPLTIPIALQTGTASTTVASGVFCASQTHAGAFGKTTARTIKEVGAPAGDITDGLPHAITYGSVFCVPKTGNALIDPSADLPGPGAISIAADVNLQ